MHTPKLRAAARASLALAALLGLAACAGDIAVSYVGREPAPVPEAAELRTIAVLDFDRRDGDRLASLLRRELQDAVLDGASWFTLADDRTLLAEAGVTSYRLSPVDVAAAIGAAREQGVDAVYLGEVLGVDVSGSSREEEHSRCTEWDGLFDCETREKYWVFCHDATARYDVALEVVDVRTGGTAYRDVFQGQASDHVCEDDSRGIDEDGLVAQARASVVAQIRHAVAPRNVTLQARFKQEAPALAEPAATSFLQGVELARAGRIVDACALWRSLAPGDETASPALLQNLGGCAEAEGDFDRAAALYAKAGSLLTEPDDGVQRARKRAVDQGLALQATR